MPTLRKRKTTEHERNDSVEEVGINCRSKRKKASPIQKECTCRNHPDPSWSICPVRVLCSNSVAFSAFFSQVRAQYFSSNFGSSVSLPPPYDCRQLQAIVTLEKKPQYFLCESLLCNGSYQLQGPFDSNDEVIAAFLRVFTERTGQTWDQRDTYINERSDYYCYIDYEPLENHEQKEKKVVARKTWKFVDFKNSFVPICKEVDKDVYEVFDRYIKDNCIKSEMLRNPIITGMKLSKSTLEKAADQIKQVEKQLQKLSKVKSVSHVNFVLKFGALLPPLGYNQKLMEALYRIPLSFQLCERLNSLLHFFTQHKEPHLQTRVRLDNLAEWEKPIQFQMSHLIEKNDQEFILIQKYLENSSRCRNQNFVIEAIYKIQNEFESTRFQKYEKTCTNRKLLWHGTSARNVRSILCEGLMNNAGRYRSERGIYFADMASKSLGFCKDFPKGCYGLFLCEVALGKRFLLGFPQDRANKERDAWHYHHDGWCSPDEAEDVALPDGAIIPLGKSTCQKYDIKHGCNHPEYIIMKEEQIRLRYLVLCRDNY